MTSGQTTSERGDGKSSEGTVPGMTPEQPEAEARPAAPRRDGGSRSGPAVKVATGRASRPAGRRDVPEDDELPPGRYLDREESWLRFNQRVLELAEDEGLHLLEAIVRSPWALATLLDAAGPGAEEQVGRIRARRQPA